MADIHQLRIGWAEAVRLGSILAVCAIAWGTSYAEIQGLTRTVARLEHEDRERQIAINRVRDETQQYRLQTTELLTELRTEVRNLRAVLERLESRLEPRR